MSEVAWRLVIAGRVQMVGYRDWMVAEATAHGVRGWVRNRREGTVEALVCGAQEAVEAMVEACRRGPRAAEVSGVEQFAAEAPDTAGFMRLPTA